MLPIKWRPQARKSLAQIVRYIGEHNLIAARTMRQRIEDSVLPLSEHPYLFKPGRVPGTREIVAHPKYIVLYRVEADCIEVLDVVHSSQQYP
ncbi:type II toxin-antitoxin system RelE/ParE family toxin [Comamonas aquatica]|uniref:type II toxin-antitoxin system RelE/ParE family toxin n=1 Tax=Comamonas aquatica TaxID=225991 RepID=UPI0028D3B1A2|nr:type II toxin-antitoxin system RelE/ParE family toxin [Comamonas aquatica]